MRRNVSAEPIDVRAEHYARAVRTFASNLKIKSVVELGCGDFGVGRMIARASVCYTGVDRSVSVVARNRELFGGRKVRFLVGDAVRDPLPDGDLCLVGDLFRHLSNAEIRLMLMRLKKYSYWIFNDHQPPVGTFIPNLEKPPGPATRLDRNSALDLRLPSFGVRHVEFFAGYLSEKPVYHPHERICSFLIRRNCQSPHLDPAYLD